MRGRQVAKPFLHDCVEKMRNGTKVYRGFKAWELNLLGGFKFLLMVILIPRKKNGFDPEFAEFFKAYNDWGGCPFKGYDSKINLIGTVKKNRNLFKVLFKKYGIFIFREKMDIEMESAMSDEITTDVEATVFSGEIPSPTSRYFKYDSDIIEDVSEKIIERFILQPPLPSSKSFRTTVTKQQKFQNYRYQAAKVSELPLPSSNAYQSEGSYHGDYKSFSCTNLPAKILEEIPVLSVDRITNASDFNSDSSGYGSALTSPSFENSLMSMNSPVNSEGSCENDDNQVQENSLLIEIGNTRNSPSPTSSVGQLVQTSHGQFANEQVLMNVSMPELGNTRNSPSFQNLPSTSSEGQLVQTSQGQFFNEQPMMNASMPELGNTRNSSSFQNFPSTSLVGQLVQTSQGQFFIEQAMVNTLMLELGNTRNASSFQNFPSTPSVGKWVQTSQGQFFNEQPMMNALMPELGNTRNSSSFQNFPSISSMGQLVQTSQGQFFNEQAMMNAPMPELGNTRNSSSIQNFPSTPSVGKLVQTSQGQFFNEQATMSASITVDENTRKSSLQNLLSTSSAEKLTQNSEEQFSKEQSMINDLISEKLADYIPASRIDLRYKNTLQNATPPVLEIPSNTLDHSYSIPYSSIAGNSAGDDRSMACNSTPPYKKFDNTQSSFLNQAQLVDFNSNSDLNGSLMHHSSNLSEGCLGMSPGTEKNNPILGNSMATEQHALSNSTPPFAAEFGDFHSSSFVGNSDINILEQSSANFSEQYSDTPSNANKDDELILGVLKKEELFQKNSSLTDISAIKKDQRYPLVADFSSIGFEILEEMETSDSESDLLGNRAQNMDCSTEFVPGPGRLQNGSMYYQMFGIPSTDCLNN